MILDLRAEARRLRPAVPNLPQVHAAARATWHGRMVNEHGSARVFAGLADQLDDAGGSPSAIAELRVFADEERRHGILCGAVVEALGGEARAVVAEGAELPTHEDAGRLEATLRNVLSVCCLSETVAVALIGAERASMPAGPLRDLLTTIYADEVGHSRFGWRMLDEHASRLDAATKERLGDYLEDAFAALVTHELAHLPLGFEPPPEGAMLGLCSGRAARELFFATVREVIVPALERRGIPARRACASLHDGSD